MSNEVYRLLLLVDSIRVESKLSGTETFILSFYCCRDFVKVFIASSKSVASLLLISFMSILSFLQLGPLMLNLGIFCLHLR